MRPRTMSAVLCGAAAGFLASIPQVAVGEIEEQMFLPPRENADIAPRFVHRIGESIGIDLPAPAVWALGTAYHFGYGAAWGALYALARERRPLPPLLGGALLGGLIYGITFPRWGGAVQVGAERPPAARSRRMTIVAASITLTFGAATSLLYERLRPGGEPDER